MKLIISKELRDILPDFKVSCYTAILKNNNDENHLSEEITEAFHNLTTKYQQLYSLEDVVNIPRIKKVRDGYKKLGKDPSHTRPACEALLRRILKYGSIYRLGDVIDVGNLLSLTFLKSVCIVDYDKIVGDITIRIGKETDEYYGINRGQINVKNLPLYSDEVSAFGNPTSDTIRTAITNQTKKILVMLIHFDQETIYDDEKLLEEMLKKYLKIDILTKIN